MDESEVIAKYVAAYKAANGGDAKVEVVGGGWYRINVNNWPTPSKRLYQINEMAERLELRAQQKV